MLLVDVCSFRLDFEQFTTNGPADTSETGGGACQDTLTTTVVSYILPPGLMKINYCWRIYFKYEWVWDIILTKSYDVGNNFSGEDFT